MTVPITLAAHVKMMQEAAEQKRLADEFLKQSIIAFFRRLWPDLTPSVTVYYTLTNPCVLPLGVVLTLREYKFIDPGSDIVFRITAARFVIEKNDGIAILKTPMASGHLFVYKVEYLHDNNP